MVGEIKQSASLANENVEMSVRGIIRAARGGSTQAKFAELLQTQQSLISKYESGVTNPPADVIDKCMKIIHGRTSDDEISLAALEVRMRKVLRGPSQASARKAFAIILDSLSQIPS